GTLVANRSPGETEGLIGLFLNTVILRTSFAGDPSIRELMRRVRNSVLDAHMHQEVPLEMVIQALERERGINRSSLFETLFFLQNVPDRKLNLPGVTASPLTAEGTPWELNLTPTTCDFVFLLSEAPE